MSWFFAFVSQGQAFTASKQAYAAGDGEEAHNLSVQGKTTASTQQRGAVRTQKQQSRGKDTHHEVSLLDGLVSGDGEEAHNLSVQGKTHQRNRDQLNAEAAQWIFNIVRPLRSAGRDSFDASCPARRGCALPRRRRRHKPA
jgi:hypothetical protein